MTESCVKSRLVEIGQRAVRIITDRAVERLLLAAFGQITGYKINSWSKNKIRKAAFKCSIEGRRAKAFSSGDKRSPVKQARHLARLRKANRYPFPRGTITAKMIRCELI